MKEFIGVTALNPTSLASLSLKQYSLMFSRIALPSCKQTLPLLREEATWNQAYLADEIEWLLEQGFVFEPEQDFSNKDLLSRDDFQSYMMIAGVQSLEIVRFIIDNYYEHFKRLPESPDKAEMLSVIEKQAIKFLRKKIGKDKSRAIRRFSSGNDDDWEEGLKVILEYTTRAVSVQLRELANIDAYPILSTPIHPLRSPRATKNDLVHIVLHFLPIPDDSVSWERLFDYRSDPDSTSKFLALRNWMNEVARAELSPQEVEDKLEYLINQFQQHINLHKLKTNTGTVETVVVAGAEFLEDLIKFKWGKIAKSLFSLKHRKIALMEGELNAPGSEIAYIVKARDTFR